MLAVIGALVVGIGVGLAWSRTKAAPPAVSFMPVVVGPLGPLTDEVHIKGGADLKLSLSGSMLVGFRVLTFPPGAALPWHQHPGAAIVAVAQGQITEYNTSFAHCGPRVGPPGTLRWEPGNTTHTLINNTKAPVIVYVVSFDTAKFLRTPLIPESRPAGCPDVP
jgi:quercetin dioxygenase-like cupin family protein